MKARERKQNARTRVRELIENHVRKRADDDAPDRPHDAARRANVFARASEPREPPTHAIDDRGRHPEAADDEHDRQCDRQTEKDLPDQRMCEGGRCGDMDREIAEVRHDAPRDQRHAVERVGTPHLERQDGRLVREDRPGHARFRDLTDNV